MPGSWSWTMTTVPAEARSGFAVAVGPDDEARDEHERARHEQERTFTHVSLRVVVSCHPRVTTARRDSNSTLNAAIGCMIILL